MIEVRNLTIVEREIYEVPIVRVLLNKNDFAGTNWFEDPIRNGCFSGARASTDANYHAHKSIVTLIALLHSAAEPANHATK